MQLQVAFATDRHARDAMSMIGRRPELFDAAEPNLRLSAETDLAVLDINLDVRNRDRMMALVRGVHGIVVRAIA
jgi:hypothetical protein